MPRLSIILLLLVVLFASCSTERKFARQFNAKANQISVLAIRTDYIFKNNEKQLKAETAGLGQAEIEQLKLENTRIIKLIDNDSVLLDLFFDSYTAELQRYGIRVFDERKIDAFFETEQEAWISHLAQVELDEFDYAFQDSEVFGGTIFTFDYIINGLTFNAWFELSKVNDTQSNQARILFASSELYDEFNGAFVQNLLTGQVRYRLSHDTIGINTFLNFVSHLGRLYAGYTYDQMMNTYIDKHTDPARRTNRWYRYDPYRQRIFTTEADRFVPLEN